jgi:hypothetical protein
MGRYSTQQPQHPILKARAARLQDLRWRRDVVGITADLAVSPEMLTPRFARRSMNCGEAE